MVREVKFVGPVDETWIEPPECRESVLDDFRLLPRVRRRRAERRRRLQQKSQPTAAPPRDLAGADWLREETPVVRRRSK